MGVSFKVSKTGRRFRPKPFLQSENSVGNATERLNSENSCQARKLEAANEGSNGDIADVSRSSAPEMPAEHEVSFTLNLYPKEYSIRKQLENDAAQPSSQDVPKLHPYDRASETLFSAIEAGRLPADLFEDIPCKYVEGALVCEVRDYRNCASGQESPSTVGYPVISRVRLKMSLENVVKDIPLISDHSWTYGDLMEVESRILKALQPKLDLDPTPKLDRLCEKSVCSKLNLSLSNTWRKRQRQVSEGTVTSNMKKVRVPEGSDLGSIPTHLTAQQACDNLALQNFSTTFRPNSFGQDASGPVLPSMSHMQRYPMGVGNSRHMQDQGPGSIVASSGSPTVISYAENTNSSGKRNNQDGQMSPISCLSKRARTSPAGPDLLQRQMGQQREGLHGSDMTTALLQQVRARGMHYGNLGNQRFSPQLLEGAMNQETRSMQLAGTHQGVRFGAKQEQFEMEKFDGSGKNDLLPGDNVANHMDAQSQLQTRVPQQVLLRPNISQAPWSNIGQQIEKDGRREDQYQRRKGVQSPHVSSGALPQSPMSSVSGEISSGSMGPHFGAVASSQKEKSAVTSVPGVGGVPSFNPGINDSVQRQHQAQAVAKRRSNPFPKTPGMVAGVSPAGAGHMSGQLYAHSPSTGNPASADQAMLERFSKIDMVTRNHHLNIKKNKVDECHRQHRGYSPQNLMLHLSNISNHEDFKDDSKPLSKSLVGGSMNTCKTRVLDFILKGNASSAIPRIRARMFMSERPTDGTVAWHYGDMDDGFSAEDDRLSTLPSTHMADLLAEQLCSLMKREGYEKEDYLQAKPSRVNAIPNHQGNPNSFSGNPTPDMQQYAETGEVAKPVPSGNISANPTLNIARMSPQANSQALQMSQGSISSVALPMRPHQLDPQLQPPQSQPQQNQQPLFHQQYQRPPMMLSPNALSQLNAMGQGSGVQMVNKSSLQMPQMIRQQQQQPQQQAQMHRKIMMGLGAAVGMGNNMVGLGGLPNSMGIRGMGGTGISAPMQSLSGITTIGQNPVNMNTGSNLNTISQPFRSGGLTPALLNMFPKLKMGRAGVLGSPQSGLAAMSGARQMHPGSAGLSVLGQNSVNRANMGQMPQAAMSPMGPPKMMGGIPYVNLQQQVQLQQQHQHQQQLQHQQQQQLQQLQQQSPHQQPQHQSQHQQPQQHDTASPLQAVLSPPPQVGSPSTVGASQMNQAQQQLQPQPSPQQMSQRTPISPQISSGDVHAVSAGNPEACPPSPQLSSQTLGSVGSITNSPMELQGVNKSNSAGNA